ncbi:class I SAM-dependent methyltransferase [Bacillus taeanensis]|uniref:Class I SAM-dependent methyltransferase n=1 Tax=Bacillus taeanensis TaxID=273032 RepID=A0A366Y5I2_9BACI|nr:class I SAM-dependent methyltransferase [Bacillus taeanensis]
MKTPVEKLFDTIDETAVILQKELSITYLEAIAETGENLFQKEILQELNDDNTKKVTALYNEVNLEEFKAEEIRKALQLAILKGMREAVQPHHEMTPDAVALFIGYLVNKWTKNKENFSMLDPAVGTGNLFTAVLNQTKKTVTGCGVEADETLLKMAYINATLQNHPIELFHGDSVQPLFVDPVDIVICDLPIGYYPNDQLAASYQLKAEEGLSFVHHLLIEQSLNYAKDGAILIFLIPNFLFGDEGADKLQQFIKDKAIIQGLLQLPLSMFKDEKYAKSIFMIQKKGEHIQLPKQALLAELPSFTKQEALSNIMKQIDQWFLENTK